MSGKFSGVQASFRNLTSTSCIYVHCHAHRVTLVLVDTCSSVTGAGDLFDLLEAIHNFITASTMMNLSVYKKKDMNKLWSCPC